MPALFLFHSAGSAVDAVSAKRLVVKNTLEAPFDHSAWDQFLKQFVNENGEVNYGAVQKDRTLLDAYIKKLQTFNINEFRAWPREEQMALFINAYHAGLIRLITDHYPMTSIQGIPGIWDTMAIQLGESLSAFSLNQLQHEELLENFGDEKIHTALSCGARSCPRLSRDAFDGPRLEGQLFLATQKFVNDTSLNKVDTSKGELWLSLIFRWYKQDFLLDFGSVEQLPAFKRDEAAVVSFFAYYLEDTRQVEFLEENNFKIKYLPFDWSLNDWKPAEETVA